MGLKGELAQWHWGWWIQNGCEVNCADQIWQALTVSFQIMLGTSIITHILCRWFGSICEGGWGWAAAKQSLDLGPVGAGEGAGGGTGKAVNKVASEAVGKAVGERVDGRPGGWGAGRGACEGARGGISTMALGLDHTSPDPS